MKRIICLDFDGVVHSYTSGWKGAREIPDPPVPGAMQFVVTALDEFEVHIFSSRSNQWGGRTAMQKYVFKCLCEIAADYYLAPPWWRERVERAGLTGPWQQQVETVAAAIVKEIKWPTEKPPAFVSIDDRAIPFDGKGPTLEEIANFKPWYKRGPEPKCKRCQDERWVCENHEDRPWSREKPNGCTCGAGAPCPDCNNEWTRDTPPAPAPGTKIICDRDGYRH